jgi:hypothetical protein
MMHIHNLRVLTILAAVAAVLSPPALWSQQEPQPTGSCTLAGTWYGGGDLTKYLMTVIPGAGGDFIGIADAAFSLSTLGFPVKTVWPGLTIKGSGKSYEMFSIGMVNSTASFPAPAPEVWAVHATARMVDCDTLHLDYDFFGAYYWPTDKQPFLSPPDYVVVPPPFTETYRRMPAICTQCPKK